MIYFLGYKQAQHSNVMFPCDLCESVLLQPQMWTCCVRGDAVRGGHREDVESPESCSWHHCCMEMFFSVLFLRCHVLEPLAFIKIMLTFL